MTTALKIIEIARKEIGTVESPPNSNLNKYGKHFNINGVAWCALFCSWCVVQIGLGLPKINIAYVPAWVEWFKSKGHYFDKNTIPKVGDFVFFAFSKEGISKNWAEHIGIVEKINSDGTITTIEGNTSAGNTGSQSSGGGVHRRTDRKKPYITGYGRPFYK